MATDHAGQLVNEAISFAVRRLLDSAGKVDNSDALARSIGKRIRGTYGFDLRRQTDLHPDLTAQQLYTLIIVPHEFPWDTETAADAAGSSSGARDRARRAKDGPIFDPDDPDLTPAEEVPGRVAELRARLRGGL